MVCATRPATELVTAVRFVLPATPWPTTVSLGDRVHWVIACTYEHTMIYMDL
jgi:hypothetical protein